MADAPVQVDPNTGVKSAVTAVQYIMSAVTSYALGKGWVNSNDVVQILALVPIIVPAAYGVYKTWVGNEKQKTMEAKLPDSVAVLKGEVK